MSVLANSTVLWRGSDHGEGWKSRVRRTEWLDWRDSEKFSNDLRASHPTAFHVSYVLIEPMNAKLSLFLSTLPLVAQAPAKIDINVDGKPFATFNSGVDANKPYLWPIRSANGKIVTRRWPMEKNTGESTDHPHHRGLWFSYDEVNGYHFWGNDPSWVLKDPRIGKIVVKTVKYDERAHRLIAEFDWTAPGGKVILHENRVMTFRPGAQQRIVDVDITLIGPEKVVFGDTKEGAFAIRLADSMTEKSHGGAMVNADGARGMKNVWGKRSNWVDYSGNIDGEKIGVVIFDAATNPRHPTYWHARDYGLFALNPFGQHAFDPSQPESNWTLDAGQPLRFRWRVVIHSGDAETAHIGEMYNHWRPE
jgi:hypothetical protein